MSEYVVGSFGDIGNNEFFFSRHQHDMSDHIRPLFVSAVLNAIADDSSTNSDFKKVMAENKFFVALEE